MTDLSLYVQKRPGIGKLENLEFGNYYGKIEMSGLVSYEKLKKKTFENWDKADAN